MGALAKERVCQLPLRSASPYTEALGPAGPARQRRCPTLPCLLPRAPFVQYNNFQAGKDAYQLFATPLNWVEHRGPSICDDIPWWGAQHSTALHSLRVH